MASKVDLESQLYNLIYLQNEMKDLHQDPSRRPLGGSAAQHNIQQGVVANSLLHLALHGLIASRQGSHSGQHLLTERGASLVRVVNVQQVQQLYKALRLPA